MRFSAGAVLFTNERPAELSPGKRVLDRLEKRPADRGGSRNRFDLQRQGLYHPPRHTPGITRVMRVAVPEGLIPPIRESNVMG